MLETVMIPPISPNVYIGKKNNHKKICFEGKIHIFVYAHGRSREIEDPIINLLLNKL